MQDSRSNQEVDINIENDLSNKAGFTGIKTQVFGDDNINDLSSLVKKGWVQEDNLMGNEKNVEEGN